MVNVSSNSLLTGIASTPSMEAIFSAGEQVQAMLRFEAALSGALEECALAPAGVASPLEQLLKDGFLTQGRADVLIAGAARSGNIAIPFVKMLTAEVATLDPVAAGYVHFGATSQDVLDTATVLQLKEALRFIEQDVQKLLASCVTLAESHANTVMPGRTWLQQGPPVTLGLKAAGWAASLDRHEDRLRQASGRALMLQFGGAVGTLASLHEDGLRVSTALARRLGLAEPTLPWHSHRDSFAELATAVGLLTGTLGKMACDLSLLMQTEVGEVSEPSGVGRGGSSTMPHKRNPVGCAAVLAVAVRMPGLVSTMLSAMPQEHERALGGWQAEWETLPEIFRLCGATLAAMKEIVANLEVHPERMVANLRLSHGSTMSEAVSAALTEYVGRDSAHALVEGATRKAMLTQTTLLDVMTADAAFTAHISANELERLLQPENYLGSTKALISRAIKSIADKES